MKRRVLASVSAMIFLFSIFMTFSGLTYNSFDGEYYRLTETSDSTVQAFDEDEKYSYLVNSGTLYVYSRDNCAVVNSVYLKRKTGKFIIDTENSVLYVFSSSLGSMYCELWSLRTLTLKDTFVIQASYTDLEFISVSSEGNVFFVECSDLAVLQCYFTDSGMLRDVSFDSSIHPVCVFENMCIVYSGNGIYRVNTDNDNLSLSKICTTGNVPCQLLSRGAYISSAGELCKLSDGTEILTGFVLPDILSYAGRVHFMFSDDGSGGVFGVSGSTTLTHVDSSWNIDYRYDSSGDSITAVGPYSLLVYRTGQYKGLYIASYDSFTVRSQSGEEEKKLPENWLVSGGYIIVEQGTTVSSLIDESGALVSYNGESVTSGVCRTGMGLTLSENSYVICVKGDVTASGTVNSKDFEAMEKHICGVSEFSETQIVAADLNDDGRVNTQDLVLFRNSYLRQ